MGAEPNHDKIRIRDLAVRCVVGVYPEERREKQEVIVNVTLHADLRKACATDCLEDTVDYKGIKKRLIALIEGSSENLIERLAQRIAELCLEEKRVERVDVTVDKPGALRFARSVAVEISRGRRSSDRADPSDRSDGGR